MPYWQGHKKGKVYHSIVQEAPSPETASIFSLGDYIGVVVLPVVSGLLFYILGLVLYYFSPLMQGRQWLLLLHLAIALYLILSPDFQMTYRLQPIFMLAFSMAPALAIQYARLFPMRQEKKVLWPWVISMLFLLMHAGLFRYPEKWLWVEKLLVGYIVFSYGYWILQQIIYIRKYPQDIQTIVVKYQLKGQLMAFIVPLLAVIAIFIYDVAIPLNFLAPLTILFPLFFFVGVLLGKIQSDKMQFAQIERRALLGNVMTGLAHEINNPLHFIYAGVDPLRENIMHKGDPAASIELVDAIEEGAVRIKNILQALRFYAHPGDRSVKLENINEIIEQSLHLLRPLWNNKVTLVENFLLQDEVQCNKTEIGQVIMNLLNNATQSIETQGSIYIDTKKIDNTAKIIIKDTGVGIDASVQKRIFDPFFTTKKPGSGTGLGLSIVQDIMARHNGNISVESEKGKGTTFILTLPL
ncbi:MAG: GHKL domain-containing protein [Deltaproteobacteria bacterium]|nr:GHKL domain-containing protein [Deltaproteobacteria bacterium]